MPRKPLPSPDGCQNCHGRSFYKNGKCKNCANALLKIRTKERIEENGFGFLVAREDLSYIRSDKFRDKLAEIMEGVDYST